MRIFFSLLLMTSALAIIATPAVAAEPAPQVDEITLEQAKSLFARGNLVDAEKLFVQVRAAVEAKKLPQRNLGPCLDYLCSIYRAWGENDEALKLALRYREFMLAQFSNDPTRRSEFLDKSASEISDIYFALDRPAEAEKYLQADLQDAKRTSADDPLRTLVLQAKLARLAEAQDETEKARQSWNRVIELGAAISQTLIKQQGSAAAYPEFESDLAAAYAATERQAEGIGVFKDLLNLHVAKKGTPAAIKTCITMGSLFTGVGKYGNALEYFEKARRAQHQYDPGSSDEADVLSIIAAIYKAQGQENGTQESCKAAAAIYGKALQQADSLPHSEPQKMKLLDQLSKVNQQAGQNKEAIDACSRLLELRQQMLGEKHRLTYEAKSTLGSLDGASQNYEAALPKLQDAVAYWTARKPAAPLQLARALNDLAFVERGIGSFNDAKSHFEAALQLREKNLPNDDLVVGHTLANLASVLSAKGEYAQAVVLFEKAIGIYEGHSPGAEEALSNTLLNQAMAFKSQGQLTKAVELCQQALEKYKRVCGAEAPGAVPYYNALASLQIAQGKIEAADQFSRAALELCQRTKLDRQPVTATALHQKATIELTQHRYADARRDWNDALEIERRVGQNAQAARTLNCLALIAVLENRRSDAERHYRESLDLQGETHAYPSIFYQTNCGLAEILHRDGKQEEAVARLQDAVKVLETPRAGTVGALTERAEYFAEFASAYDLLVAWNLELDHVDEAFAYAERGRNRTFLDQLSLAGVDLRDTLSGASGKKLLAQESNLREKLGTLRAQAVAITQVSKNDSKPGKKNPELEKLAGELDKVQSDYAQVWADIRNASPYYREQLSRDAKFGSLNLVREELKKLNSLMLFYHVGADKSVLLVIDPADEKTLSVPLVVPSALAAEMSVKDGPLTRPVAVQLVNHYLADLRDRTGGRGLGGVVQSPRGVMAAEKGTILAEMLVPRVVRDIVSRRAPQSVIIVPDGALHELPFEALLLEREPSPKYLLDVFPPIAYAPSANILMNLVQRPAADSKATATLTVGNPKYIELVSAKSVIPVAAKSEIVVGIADSKTANKSQPGDKLAQRSLASVSREAYLGLGGQLPPLPATAKECERIARAFQGGKITVLEAEQATERNVRDHIGGCRFIHLAAHGLVDQQHDNLFGAIALTPPAQTVDSAEDDGFLSLHEIHELPLSGCQLAVLSACQTNVGPDRPLEAGSTLAQAFLAAGARRAICSHWSVDDASTAELMGTFFEQIAKAARQYDSADKDHRDPIAYAAALHAAQKQVRSQPQWSSPYYWAPFVLIGPPQ